MPEYLQAINAVLQGPPLQTLTPVLVPGIFRDSGELPDFGYNPLDAIFGAIITVQDPVPPYLGRDAGVVDRYHLPLVTTYFQAFTRTSSLVITQIDEVHYLEQVLLLSNAGGPRVFYRCLPGIAFAFSWLRFRG